MKNKEHEIIEVALQLFSEKGYTSTSVDEIAKESGIAKASFYKFFQSKEDVLVATVVMHGHKIDDAICKMYSDTHLPPEQKIAGTLVLTAASNMPGVILSQFGM